MRWRVRQGDVRALAVTLTCDARWFCIVTIIRQSGLPITYITGDKRVAQLVQPLAGARADDVVRVLMAALRPAEAARLRGLLDMEVW